MGPLLSFDSWSSWLGDVTNVACRTSSDSDCRSPKARPHDFRRVGTSMLFRKNFAVHQVQRAGMWASQTMFTSSV